MRLLVLLLLLPLTLLASWGACLGAWLSTSLCAGRWSAAPPGSCVGWERGTDRDPTPQHPPSAGALFQRGATSYHARVHRPLALVSLLIGCPTPGPHPDSRRHDDSRSTAPETIPDAVDSASCPALLISEVVSANRASLEDGDGDSPDWIELYNASARPIDLSGWSLSDDPEEPETWSFPAMEIEAGGFLIVFASGKGDEGPLGELHTGFAISASGEELLLTCPDGLADAVTVPALDPDIAWGRAQTVHEQTLLGAGDEALLAVDPGDGWTAASFDDSLWESVTLGVGFDGLDSDAEPVEVALGATTEQSSDGYSRTGEQAVDGDLSTFSHTADGDLEPWWQADLGGHWSVSEIRLHNRSGCCPERLYNITVRLLDAEGEQVWASELLNPTAEGQAPADPGSLLQLRPEQPVLASSLRVEKGAVGGAGSSEWLSLAEVEVMAVEASPYADVVSTDLTDRMLGVSARAGLRTPIQLPDHPPDRALLSCRWDDGFGAWLDGALLAEAQRGEDSATEAHDGSRAESVSLDPSRFQGSEGLLALELLNLDKDDDDLLLLPSLTLQWIELGEEAWFPEPSPGAPNGPGWAGIVEEPIAAVQRGFFEHPFTVHLSCPTPGARLIYTTDGSTPSPDNGVAVAPEGADGTAAVEVPIETTTVLRAAAFLEGWGDSAVISHSYLFPEAIIRQPAAPPGLPATWDGIGQGAVSADYEMDPEVVDDPAYREDLLRGLRAIPTLSIAMEPDDLWSEESGIYIHTQQRGDDWERRASIELLETDGSGFHEHCGLRIHGYGWRAHSATKKHSFRLEFSPEYGPSKLEYPLFPDAPAERFDSIVLRSQGSRGWQDFRDPEQAQYLRDAFARDTARDMGKVDGHGRHVHLYLNGLYWGLYQMVERPDAGFGEEYFGGRDEDYDAINRRTTTNEAIDGTLEAYEELLALADQDVTDPAVWEAIQAVLDVDDLIDYMLIHQYTVNRDGPCCFEHNNMRGVRERREGALWRWFVWDMEYSIWEATDDTNIEVDVAGSISHVYARLRLNDAFRARFSERAARHLGPGGALTAEACTARWEARSAEIEDAIVAESARWGDTDREPPYTRDVEWMSERTRLLEEFFPHRSAQLERQLIEAGLMED